MLHSKLGLSVLGIVMGLVTRSSRKWTKTHQTSQIGATGPPSDNNERTELCEVNGWLKNAPISLYSCILWPSTRLSVSHYQAPLMFPAWNPVFPTQQEQLRMTQLMGFLPGLAHQCSTLGWLFKSVLFMIWPVRFPSLVLCMESQGKSDAPSTMGTYRWIWKMLINKLVHQSIFGTT